MALIRHDVCYVHEYEYKDDDDDHHHHYDE